MRLFETEWRNVSMKNGQWIKYTAVVLTFVIMAGFFWPGMKAQVNATETEEQTADWNIKVQYNWGEETEEIEISPVSGVMGTSKGNERS